MRCLLLVFAALGLGAGSLAAQTNAVTFGRANAHPTRILAKFKDSAMVAAGTNSLAQLGSKIHRQFKSAPGLVLLEESDAEAVAGASAKDEPSRRSRLLSRIGRLKKSKLFEYVEPDYIYQFQATPADQAFFNGTLWALRNVGQNGGKAGADIGATSAWDLTTGSTNVIVAVVDSGIRYTHYDLTNQMWRNPGETGTDDQGQDKATNGIDDDNNGYVDDVFGINAVTGSGDPDDDVGHGTHVAGTIGAAANDGNPSVGVAWQVQLMACKIGGAYGIFTSDEIEGIGYAVTNGARVINASWGGFGFSFSLYNAINQARRQGVLFVAAAGNSASDNDQYSFYPASYPLDNIISVAAVDRNDYLASFSDYGATTVHLGAPGVDIYSCFNGSDTDYQLLDGTSMAAPHVSGVAALVFSQFPGADLTEVRQRILLGTVPIPALAGRTTTGGRLNAYNALTVSGSGVLQLSVSPPNGSTLLLNSPQTVFVKVTDLFNVTNATVSATVTDNTNYASALSFVYSSQGVYTNVNAFTPTSTNLLTMTVIATAPDKIAATNFTYYSVVPRPANDDFADATKIPTGGALYLANNQFATNEPGEPSHAGVLTAAGSLWWSWMPTVNTNALIDTTGSMVDTVVAVYTGNALGSLLPVASTNDVGQDRQAHLRFNAQAGTTYRIAVASLNANALGSLVVRLAPGGQLDTIPPQIFCTNLSGLTFTNSLISVGGTALDPAPNATGLSEVLVSVNGAFTYSAAGTTNWTAPVALQPGLNVITATAFDRAANASSPVSVQANYLVNDPVNDVFANAIPLPGVSGTVWATNTYATKEVGEPNHAGNNGGKSVWWSWTAANNGVLTLHTSGSSFDTLLGLYTGARVSALTTIASNDDYGAGNNSYLRQAVRSNQVYHIAVDGYDGVSGDIKLFYAFSQAAVYHLTVTNTPGGVALPPSTDVRDNDTVTLTAVPDANYLFDYWDGDVPPDSTTNNPLALAVTNNMTVTAHFRSLSFTDGFESGNLHHLAWATAGNQPWLVQSNVVAAGRYAARSGTITDNQSSSLILTTNLVAGNISFDFRVSSETNWDFLGFYVDHRLVQRWSGEVGWANCVFPVTAGGIHTLEWRYAKDASLSAGLDAAFVDNVNLPVLALKGRRLGDGTFFVDLYSPTNQTVVIQTSTNLVHWDNIATNVPSDALMRILAPAAPTKGTWFYRAIIP